MKILPADVEKEIRALALPWLWCLAVIVLGLAQVPLFRGAELVAYMLGVSLLGGLSMGHEYSGRTLSILLSQPARRERLFIVKWGVLAAMLLTIALVTLASNTSLLEFSDWRFRWLPVLCSLCVGPWLTMYFRNPLAGTIFAMGLPGTVFITIQLTYFWITGLTLDESALFPRVAVVVCAVGAVMGWRAFMRLEAIDGAGRDLQLPAWSGTGSATVTRRNPIWLLVKKELGLQQIPLAFAGVMIVGWMVAMTLRGRIAHITEIFNILTLIVTLPTAVIIGAVAAGEERQLGTHEWQLLLPLTVARQWFVKVTVAMTLTFVLCVLLPSPLLYFMNGPLTVDPFPLLRLSMVLATAMVAALGLYFSSLSTNGLRAIVLAVVAIAIGLLPGARLAGMRQVARNANSILGRSLDYYGYYQLSYATRVSLVSGVAVIVAVAFIAMLLRFGLTNYRSAAPIGRHLWWQGLLIGLCLSTAAFILTVGSMFGLI
jgi:hypothetical protein